MHLSPPEPPDVEAPTPEIADSDLLQAWVREQRQADFAELVRRHLERVRAVARRQVGPDLADDAAQMTFAILARKAASLTGEGSLAGWLHRVTYLQCRGMVRGRIRERRKLESAMQQAELAEARDPLAEALPLLDAAICDLPDKDRELIHLRYSEGLSFTEAARRTGRTEVALRQQASRALGKLQGLLRGRGVAVPVTALAAGLGVTLGGGPTASAAVVATISTGALASSATVGGGWLAWMAFLTMTTKQGICTGVALAVLLAAGPLVWQAHEIREAGRKAAAAPPASTGRDVAATGDPVSGAAPERPVRPGGAARKGPPMADMTKVAELLQAEVKNGLGEWLAQSAELEAGRTAAALKLSPVKTDALRKLLSGQAAATVKDLMSDEQDEASGDEGPSEVMKQRRETNLAELEAWYAANLSPQEKEAQTRMKAEGRGAEIRRLADASVYPFISAVPLSPEQTAELSRVAAARAAEQVDGSEPARSVGMGVNVNTVWRRPLEEVSGDLVEQVLDPAQQELWRVAQQRDRIFRDDLPKRVLDRAVPMFRDPELREILKEMNQETQGAAQPGH